jgi:hypothetical protein
VDGDPTVESVVAELAADAAVSADLGASGAMAVTELLEWKAARDRRLERWRVKDVDAFLLGYAPQQFPSDPALVAALPPAVERYLAWLDAAGRLRGDSLTVLRERVAELTPEYTARAGDPAAWSPAKVLLAEMEAEGIDTDDPGAVEAWMAELEAREKAARRGRRRG